MIAVINFMACGSEFHERAALWQVSRRSRSSEMHLLCHELATLKMPRSR
jgi:hypothetical protein